MIGGILSELLGDVLAGALFGGLSRNRHPEPLPEGQWNGSLGALSAFLAVMAVVFGLVSLSGSSSHANYRDMGGGIIVGMAACSLLAGCIAFRLGRRAPTATKRHLGLAKFGVVAAIPAIVVSAIAVVAGVIRVRQW